MISATARRSGRAPTKCHPRRRGRARTARTTRSQATAFEPRLCTSRRRGARSAPTTPYPPRVGINPTTVSPRRHHHHHHHHHRGRSVETRLPRSRARESASSGSRSRFWFTLALTDSLSLSLFSGTTFVVLHTPIPPSLPLYPPLISLPSEEAPDKASSSLPRFATAAAAFSSSSSRVLGTSRGGSPPFHSARMFTCLRTVPISLGPCARTCGVFPQVEFGRAGAKRRNRIGNAPSCLR